MSDATELYAYESGEFHKVNHDVLSALLDIKEAYNPSHLDWLKLHDDGCIDLDMSVLRLAQRWSQLSAPKFEPYQFGPEEFTADNIAGTFMQYELDVEREYVRMALAVMVKAGLLRKVGRKYSAIRPSVVY